MLQKFLEGLASMDALDWFAYSLFAIGFGSMMLSEFRNKDIKGFLSSLLIFLLATYVWIWI